MSPPLGADTDAGEPFGCPWCQKTLCARCHEPWSNKTGGHYNTSVKSCSAAARSIQEDDASAALINATSKSCPSCGYRTSHFHGHACHHISPDTNGCPRCHTHWCFRCGSTDKQNTAERGSRGRCQCAGRSWSTFCSSNNIAEHMVMEPYPHDGRCGCPICPQCRPGRPCEQCSGDCVVCRGVVEPGPTELAH